jgi:hypothetical protein
MESKSSTPVSIKFSDVLLVFEFTSAGMPREHRAYICANTGKIYFSSDATDGENELPDDLETSDAYISVPRKNDLDLGRDLVFSFVRQELPEKWDAVRAMFRKRGAYGRFKDLLHSQGVLEKWYEFEASATGEALRAWCEDVGIQLVDPPSSAPAG